jgi:dipeptidyl aminopeptidase/acylaminoacyl peptidase
MTTVAPYGAWASPVTTDLVAGGSVGLPGGLADGADLYWLVADPAQRGRVTLLRRRDGVTAELTPEHNLRSRVHEYGGGAFAARAGTAVYTDFASGQVFALDPGAAPRPIAGADGLRFGGFAFIPGRRAIVCVREDARAGGQDTIDTVVVLDLDTANPGGGRVLAQGADFYADPQVSADGWVAWYEWDHPNMPWDTTRVKARHADGGPVLDIAGDGRSSVLHPAWAADGSLLYLSDASGYWNFRRWRDGVTTVLHDHPYDFCSVPWSLTAPPYAPLADGSIGCTWLDGGWTHLGYLRPDGRLDELHLPLAWAEVTPGDPVSVASVLLTDRPGGLYTVDWARGQAAELARTSAVTLPAGYASPPRDLVWESPDGPVHAWFYAPANPDFQAPTGELPPVLVQSHGGPTAFARPRFDLEKQFWTSRGIGVLDVNYGGSAGFGRAYRERLAGRWGIVDVRDCAQAPLELARRGLADPARCAIEGGSAGGFTTLACLCFTDTFAAGISRYGIGDLEALATDTHKYEAHYLDGLVAPYPEGRQTYLDRSPIHHLDRLNCPMLILQGADDPVVPPNQATSMAAAVQAKGLPVTLIVYPGEGHGFRQAATIRDRYDRSLAFLGQVFKFAPKSL